ncbi:hypothetical protein D3C77_367930 [compost metagenome]
MKKLSIFAATAALSLTLATVASANTGSVDTTTTTESTASQVEQPVVRLTVSEPFVTAEQLIIAPLPIELNEKTVFYQSPEGKAWSVLAPQNVTPTGKVQGEWFEIYTWLGNAWIHLPEYTLAFK